MSTLGTVAIALAVVVALVAFATRRSKSGDRRVAPGAAGAERSMAVRDLWKLGRSGGTVERAAAALRANGEIDAVRIVREATGLGLAESKRVVDELRQQLETGGPLAKLLEVGAPPGVPADEPEFEDVRVLVEAGRMVDAIKLHREKTGAGLTESKAAVDRIAARLRG